MLEVTEGAQTALKTIVDEKNITEPIRIYLAGGCGGAQLALAVDEAKDSDDSYQVSGLTYVVDKALGIMAGGLKLDYVDDGERQGFLVTSDKPIQMGGGGGCGGGGGGSCCC